MNKFNESILQKNFLTKIFIILSLLIIFELNGYNRIFFSLSSDELFSVGIATHILENGIFPIEFKYLSQLSLNDTFLTWKAADQSPILYEIILAFWLRIFGDSDTNAKLLSLSFYFISIVISNKYVLQNESIKFKIAFLGFILFTPVIFIYATEARTYMMVFMLSIILLYQLKQTILSNGLYLKNNKNLIFNILVMLCMSFSHYYGFILTMILLLINIYIVSIKRIFQKQYFLYLFIPISIILYIVFFNKFGIEYASSGKLAWSANLSFSNIVEVIFQSLYGLIGTTILVTILITFFIISKAKDSFFKITSFVFFIYTMIYLVLTFKNGTYHIRHYIFILPFIFYSLSYIASQYYQVLILIFIILGVNLINLFTKSSVFVANEDYRSAGEFVSKEFQTLHGKTAIVTTWCPNESLYYYYLKNTIPKDKIICINTIDDFKKKKELLNDGFIIESHSSHQSLIKLIQKNNDFFCTSEAFENINVNVCRKQ